MRGKLADNVGDHVVLPPEGAVLVTHPGTESSYRPPHLLNKGVMADSKINYSLAYHFTRAAPAACKTAFPNLYMEIPTIIYQVAFQKSIISRTAWLGKLPGSSRAFSGCSMILYCCILLAEAFECDGKATSFVNREVVEVKCL